MPNLSEILAVNSKKPTDIEQILGDSVNVLDHAHPYTFQGYSKVVLPFDGYIFWAQNVPTSVVGSLHFMQNIVQEEDGTYGGGSVVFTTQTRIPEFETPDDRIWVLSVAGARAAFSQQQGFYPAAGLWHYFGNIIPPALQTQLLDDPTAIDPSQAITSNSLALWLGLNTYQSPLGAEGFSASNIIGYEGRQLLLYPADMAPTNYRPPYGTVDISYTKALQADPYLDPQRQHWQLVQDTVKLTLYGLQNNAAMDFVDMVIEYTQYGVDKATGIAPFGIMNLPVMMDTRRKQPEITSIAMQKVINYEINYYQFRAITMSRRLLLDALPIQFLINPFP